jgi:hypothetical protein
VTDTVTIAYLHQAEVAHSFHQSLLNLVLYDGAHEARIMRGGYLAMRASSGGLEEARNKVVEAFLSRDNDWLFVVDSDMGFASDTVERLLDAADPDERPIVGALCFAWKELELDGMGGYRCEPRPTLFDYVETDDGVMKFMGRSSYPQDQMTQVAGTGAACILIHRTVLEKIRAEYGETWYSRIVGDSGKRLGEDISFCVRAGAVGFPIWVHTGVKTTHLKNVWVGEDEFMRLLALTQLANSNGDGHVDDGEQGTVTLELPADTLRAP